MAMARMLQIRGSFEDDRRNKLWRLPWDALAAGLASPIAAVAAAANETVKNATHALKAAGIGPVAKRRVAKRPATAL